MNNIILGKTIVGSSLKSIDKAKLYGDLDLKIIYLLSIIKKLDKTISSKETCKKNLLKEISNKLIYKYNLCSYKDKVISKKENKNMATYTINIDAEINNPPTMGDGQATIDYNTNFTFTRASLTTLLTPPYSDPENDPAENLRIDSLPARGELQLNGISISTVPTVVSFTEIDNSNLIYVADPADTDGDIIIININISDTGSSQYTNSGGTFTFNINAQPNNPPSQLGDGESTIGYGTNLTFTRALLTTMLSPAYVDPEGDAAQNLRINTLPARGLLKLNGSNISAGQIISFTDIDNNLLIYESDLADTDGDQVTFDFSVSDVGSGQYTT